MGRKTFPVLLLLLVAVGVAAESQQGKVWQGSAELGYVATSGNSETESLNLKGKAIHEKKMWRQRIEGSALYASEEEAGTTAERYSLEGQVDYKFARRNYLFALMAYENDKFSGYNYRVSEIVGVGRRVLERDTIHIDVEVGGGARQSELNSGDRTDEATWRGAGKLGWQISESSRFAEELTIESGSSATITKSVTSLESRINSLLSMKVSYIYRHSSDVPEGVDKSDTETAVTLVVKY